MPNYKQLLETAAAYMPNTLLGWLAAIGGTAIATIGLPSIYDLYQRYKRYILPADRSADFLLGGGIHGMQDNADGNIDQYLDTFRQINDLRNQRQDDTRANLTLIGLLFSKLKREGHSDIDAIIRKNITTIAQNRDEVTDEELELALQNAIMGGTRTRDSLTSWARSIGGPIYKWLG